MSEPKTPKQPTMEFPVGPQAYFQFHLEHLTFIDIDEGVKNIIGIEPGEFMNRSIFYLFDNFSSKNHIQATHALFQKGIEYLRERPSTDLHLNLEFNIQPENRGSKRLLLQFKKGFSNAVHKVVGFGKITDINHISKWGSPTLTVLNGDILENIITFDFEGKSTETGYDLSARELKVLKLKSEGCNTREIADALHLTTLSVYSIVRDIKIKTGLPTITLLKELIEKGKI